MAILDRNLRLGRLEIDIVARDGAAIAVVEVRTRGPGSWERAHQSVSAPKQARLRRAAALLWAQRFCRLPGIERVRFDVAAVDLDAAHGPTVDYLRAAFA